MEVFTTDRIRNVVLLGHGGAGKTSLVEAMAYLSGMTTRMGKISDGILSVILIKKKSKDSFPSILRLFRLSGIIPRLIS